MRGLQLVFVGVGVALGWRRHRSRVLTSLGLATAVSGSLWVGRRSWRRREYRDPRTAWIDAGACIASMVLLAAGTRDSKQPDLAIGLGLTAAAALGAALPTRGQRLVGAGALGLGYAVAHRLRREAGSRADFLIKLSYFVSFVIVTERISMKARTTGMEIDRAQRSAVILAERLAQERERGELEIRLHARALKALEDIKSGWDRDREAVRLRARREALRLRGALSGRTDTDRDGLASALDQALDDLVTSKTRVEVVAVDFDEELSEDQLWRIAKSTRAAVESAIRRGASHIVVRPIIDEQGIRLTIRDFAAAAANADEEHLLNGLLTEVGGSVTIRSIPDRGTRVTVRVPR